MARNRGNTAAAATTKPILPGRHRISSAVNLPSSIDDLMPHEPGSPNMKSELILLCNSLLEQFSQIFTWEPSVPSSPVGGIHAPPSGMDSSSDTIPSEPHSDTHPLTSPINDQGAKLALLKRKKTRRVVIPFKKKITPTPPSFSVKDKARRSIEANKSQQLEDVIDTTCNHFIEGAAVIANDMKTNCLGNSGNSESDALPPPKRIPKRMALGGNIKLPPPPPFPSAAIPSSISKGVRLHQAIMSLSSESDNEQPSLPSPIVPCPMEQPNLLENGNTKIEDLHIHPQLSDPSRIVDSPILTSPSSSNLNQRSPSGIPHWPKPAGYTVVINSPPRLSPAANKKRILTPLKSPLRPQMLPSASTVVSGHSKPQLPSELFSTSRAKLNSLSNHVNASDENTPKGNENVPRTASQTISKIKSKVAALLSTSTKVQSASSTAAKILNTPVGIKRTPKVPLSSTKTPLVSKANTTPVSLKAINSNCVKGNQLLNHHRSPTATPISRIRGTRPSDCRPAWVITPNLKSSIAAQSKINPELIFGDIQQFTMEGFFSSLCVDLFPPNSRRPQKPRGSSAVWEGQDALSLSEKVAYDNAMGYFSQKD